MLIQPLDSQSLYIYVWQFQSNVLQHIGNNIIPNIRELNEVSQKKTFMYKNFVCLFAKLTFDMFVKDIVCLFKSCKLTANLTGR